MNAINAIAMINQELLLKNLKSELPRQIKSEKMLRDSYMDTSELSGHTEAPIDLSRRCDSVETRKTPSPYNSSAFGESSPSLLNESPTSLTRSSSSFGMALQHTRSDTPTNRYQTNGFLQRSSSSSSRFPYENERTPSPTESIPMHHRFMREQSVNSTDDEINPYILHAVALQQKLQNIPATVSTSGQLSPDSMQYPLVLGRDGKMARPFKAYPRDPLTISATIPTSDSLNDRMSTERFSVFRQQMLEQIHAANGGRPTVTNPKMRRISTKSEQNADVDFQQKQNIEAQHQLNNQSDSSSSGNMKNEQLKDNAYFERRRKNNAAAKKSRDRRRIKEDEIAIRAAFLERENFELKIELATAKRQLAKFLEK
ncbi:protein giant-like [Sitodiplosis mosellana]|uniref:protein giant-like n=1 Tax=Sitodiplosis mosellana TaxID=263140 RepID=UPI002443F57A|nr:protein giant-like [Sitodiplosis mosellana]